jgi:hypothetical protein
MKSLEACEERMFTPNVRIVSRSYAARFRALFSTGISLGLVLFVALTTVSVLNRGSDLVGTAWKRNWDRKESVQRDLTIPKVQRPIPLQTFRSTVVMSRKPESSRDTIRESSYFLDDLNRFFQSLARFAK